MSDVNHLVERICAYESMLRVRRVKLDNSFVMSTDLSMQQIRILYLINDEPMTISDLATALSVTSPTMTGVVDRLFHKGLVNREMDPVDRRCRNISLSDEGRECIALMTSVNIQLFREAISTLDAEDLQKVESIYRKLVTQFIESGVMPQ